LRLLLLWLSGQLKLLLLLLLLLWLKLRWELQLL
jgi:hypothetical protein